MTSIFGPCVTQLIIFLANDARFAPSYRRKFIMTKYFSKQKYRRFEGYLMFPSKPSASKILLNHDKNLVVVSSCIKVLSLKVWKSILISNILLRASVHTDHDIKVS